MLNGIKGGAELQKAIFSGFIIGAFIDLLLNQFPLFFGFLPGVIAIVGYLYLCFKYGRENLNL
ncbi:hypothetical protein EXU34_12595 [Alteromonas sp. ZYF713]|nr:hypothetical protein [Alteromonas sp. ZYF713]